MNICVIGTGYVGLVTGACFADMGNNVWCVDVDKKKINALKEGLVPIYEPGLKELIDKNVREGRLFFTEIIQTGLADALFCFITVGTPPGEDGSADLTAVRSVAHSIGKYISDYTVVVNKSTVPVGTADMVKNIIEEGLRNRELNNVSFDVVSNPEFLKEGEAIEDFLRPDRVIIGTNNIRTAELMKQLYKPFLRKRYPLLVMDIRSAELTKYAANAMLALRISFMNELACLCDAVGGDIANVRLGIGTDSRIGMSFLNAGIGYGGSCFPKDMRELIATGLRNGMEMSIVEAVQQVNEKQKIYLLKAVQRRWGENLKGKRFGIWGLAYKPQTDDMREAPSINIINELISRGATIQAYDPVAMKEAKIVFADYGKQIKFVNKMMDAVKEADALLLLTEWPQFLEPDFEKVKKLMSQLIIFDGRNQFNPEEMYRLGFEYYCVGRNSHDK